MPADNLHQVQGKELLFYGLVALLMLFALVKLAFTKYFNDLFRLFFRTTLKQRQLSEQLVMTPLPSIFLNLFFIINAGLYLSFWINSKGVNPFTNFWWLFLYLEIGLTLAYTIKFVGLKISGWLFNVRAVVDAYIFIVFLVNKMIGIFLIPILFLLAFSAEEAFNFFLTISWILIGGALLYRVFLSYQIVSKQIKLNGFHFVLYVLAFEISPLLLIYKLIQLNFG